MLVIPGSEFVTIDYSSTFECHCNSCNVCFLANDDRVFPSAAEVENELKIAEEHNKFVDEYLKAELNGRLYEFLQENDILLKNK